MEEENEIVKVPTKDTPFWNFVNSRLPDWDMEDHEPAYDLNTMKDLYNQTLDMVIEKFGCMGLLRHEIQKLKEI